MPHHPKFHEYGMERDTCEFIWRHFHPSYDEEIIEDPETTLNEEEKRIDIRLERV